MIAASASDDEIAFPLYIAVYPLDDRIPPTLDPLDLLASTANSSYTRRPAQAFETTQFIIH